VLVWLALPVAGTLAGRTDDAHDTGDADAPEPLQAPWVFEYDSFASRAAAGLDTFATVKLLSVPEVSSQIASAAARTTDTAVLVIQRWRIMWSFVSVEGENAP
jgi:hypothetical protein